MQQVVEDMRKNFLRNVMISQVDTFQISKDPGVFKFECQYSFSDPMDESNVRMSKLFTIDLNHDSYTDEQAVGFLGDNILLQKYSRTGQFKVVLKKASSGHVIEVYRHGILKEKKVIPATVHSAPIRHRFITADFMSFSHDENRVIYVAEADLPASNLFKHKEEALDRFKYSDGFGDWMDGFRYPAVFVYDIKENELFSIERPEKSTYEKFVYIHPQFADATGHSVVCARINMIGVSEQGYYTNSPKSIQLFTELSVEKSHKVQGSIVRVWRNPSIFNSTHDKSEVAFYPKLSPDFSKLSFLYLPKCIPSALNSCGLKVVDLKSMEVTTVVEMQDEDGEEFSGINGHHMTLYSYDWINESIVVLNSHHHQCPSVYEVNIWTKIVKRIPSNPANVFVNESAYFLLPVAVDVFILRRDTVDYNCMIRVMRRKPDGTYVCLHDSSELLPKVNNFERTVHLNGSEAAHFGRVAADVPMDKRPMIVYLHGGPHTIYPSIYIPAIEYCIERLYTILNVNFVGSNGRGNKFAQRGCGGCGERDMEEIKDFIELMIKEKQCDPKQVHLYGTSTGGYLTLGMIGRYPDLAKTAAIFSPVVDTFSMMIDSTTLNWITAEVLGNTSHQELVETGLSDENAFKLRDRSRSNLLFNTKTKILLFVGQKDYLVPIYPMKGLFKRLREMDVSARLFEYNEQHHFLSISSQYDAAVKTVLLFNDLFEF